MRYSENHWQLDKLELRALCAVASKDETRPHLNAVCFDEPTRCAVATDGHRLVRARVEPGDVSLGSRQYLVSLAALKGVAPLLKHKGDMLCINRPDTDGKIELQAIDKNGQSKGVMHVQTVDHPFPPYDQVVPGKMNGEKRDVERYGMNAIYAADLALMQRACDATKVEVSTPEGAMDPIRYDCTGQYCGTEWTAVIMPCRVVST
ncbi:MAG: hypothetical protein KKG95_08005 [Candidatus Omnitrophica bacterium]|nr:hypothetical protein [Candidatus Omnitrophota bacterium]